MEANNFIRKKILSKFEKSEIAEVERLLAEQIKANYNQNKATVIPGFGSFTFDHLEVNLYGTTNQMQRTTKKRKRIFIVNSNFAEHFKSAVYRDFGLVEYVQKDVFPSLKVNYSEISLNTGLKLKAVKDILDQLVGTVRDKIVSVNA